MSIVTRKNIKTYQPHEIILAIMAHQSSQNAVDALNVHISSVSHYLAYREMDYASIKLTQLMAGCSLDNTAHVLSQLRMAEMTDEVLLLSYHQRPPLNEACNHYKALLSANAGTGSGDMFYLTRVLAAMCTASSKIEAASLLGLELDRLDNYLGEQGLDYQQLISKYHDFQKNSNLVSPMSISALSISSNSSEMSEDTPSSVYSDIHMPLETDEDWAYLDSDTSPMEISISPEIFATTASLGLFSQSAGQSKTSSLSFDSSSDIDFDNLSYSSLMSEYV